MFPAIMYVLHLEKHKMQKIKNHNINTGKRPTVAKNSFIFFGSYFQGLPQSFRWMCLMMDSQCRGLFPNVIKTLSIFFNRIGSSTCLFIGFFWLLSHVIYLKLTRHNMTRVSSFPSFNFWMINYSYTQKNYLAHWQNCFGQFITQKFPSLKSKQFSQFFLVGGKSERIDKI